MQKPWQKTVAKLVIWLAAEILLNFLGIDNLADYGEFVFERDVVILQG